MVAKLIVFLGASDPFPCWRYFESPFAFAHTLFHVFDVPLRISYWYVFLSLLRMGVSLPLSLVVVCLCHCQWLSVNRLWPQLLGVNFEFLVNFVLSIFPFGILWIMSFYSVFASAYFVNGLLLMLSYFAPPPLFIEIYLLNDLLTGQLEWNLISFLLLLYRIFI